MENDNLLDVIAEIKRQFWASWICANDQGGSGDPPEKEGVYAIVECIVPGPVYTVVYIGSSKNLLKRYTFHRFNLMGFMRADKRTPFFFYKESSNYRKEEIDLIRKTKPRYNYHHTKN